MGIIIYIIYFFIGCVSCLKIKTTNRDYFIAFLFLSLWSISLRNLGLANDFYTYKDVLSYDYSDLLNFYYLREPIYWFLSKFIYNYIASDVYTFIIIDIIFFLIFVSFCKSQRMPLYFCFLYILFFPSVLGLQNVYRQYLSTILLLIAIYSPTKNDYFEFKPYFFWFLSFLTHNVTILFFPLIFIKKGKNLLAYILLLFLFILNHFIDTEKSFSATGDLNPSIYLLFICMFFLGYIILKKGKISYKNDFFLNSTIYNVLLYIYSMNTMGTGQSKRVGMIISLIMLINLISFIEHRIKLDLNKKVIRTLLFLLLAILTIIFPSSRNMLLIAQ
jgi:hypothetical protein